VRIGWEICRFELQQQLRSPFVFATLVVFFLIHFLAITSTGINLWAHPLANINSAYAIAVTETTLSIFGMLPVMVFVAKAILRDHETTTAELFFVKPIRAGNYVGGRLAAALVLSAVVGLAGMLGTLTGTLMPTLDPERVAPFSLQPFVFVFAAIVLPTLLIQSALFFSVAALTRSLAATVSVALAFLAANITLASYTLGSGSSASSKGLVLADHSAMLVVEATTRDWTVSELNSLLPIDLLLESRLVWLAIAIFAVGIVFARFRLELTSKRAAQKRQGEPEQDTRPCGVQPPIVCARPNAWHQFGSQLRIDMTYVLRSPLFLLILFLGVVSVLGEHDTRTSPLANVPLHPVTSIMLGFFRYGLIQLVLVIAIYYSGTLLHRERESGVAEIVGSTPAPDWLLPLSKVLTLCVLIAVLLAATMITSIAIQAASGYTNFELGLYFQSVFVHNGAYFWMLCVLAVFVQSLVANKWLGMLALLVLYVLLISLGPLGFDHVLYSFAIPYVVHSDINGFDQVGLQIESLLVYWACVCALLIMGACLVYPRGVRTSFMQRLRQTASFGNRRVAFSASVLVVCTVAAGGWIFYNTDVLNVYAAAAELDQRRAVYETTYGRYENQPSPSFSDIDMEVALFPAQGRMESKGRSLLRNNKRVPIEEFVISLSVIPKLEVVELVVIGATRKLSDVENGFYLYALNAPLLPGQTVPMTWHVRRANRGFANSDHDLELVRNGSYLSTLSVMPVPGFDETRKLTDNAVRRKLGLVAKAELPKLGDPSYLDNRALGIDGNAEIRVVLSTDHDQMAVAPGQLKREWSEHGRRYFEYVMERPIPPALAFTSGRYQVARDNWQNVPLEVYFDPKHAFNAQAMLTSAKLVLDYCSRNFSPYQFSQFRIVEYPRYRSAARAFPGMTAYSETAGFIADLKSMNGLDYATIHELSHMWWGAQASGAYMQGRELLNEGLAQYTTLLIFEKHADRTLLNSLIEMLQRGYLASRGEDGKLEQPLIKTDDQGYLSYDKGPLAVYALREVLGEEAVNRALRSYLSKFAFKPPPFPTSLDLVRELRAVAGPEHQEWITDLFERIVLYDLEVSEVSAQVNEGFEVILTVDARQLEASGNGEETEVPLRGWFDVAVFAAGKVDLAKAEPLYLQKHQLSSGANTITIKTRAKPGSVAVDPYRKMPDRRPENNVKAI
jgi:ABC-type transport system involved in multi-copper enzyme maturation permease subunit